MGILGPKYMLYEYMEPSGNGKREEFVNLSTDALDVYEEAGRITHRPQSSSFLGLIFRIL